MHAMRISAGAGVAARAAGKFLQAKAQGLLT
jgi:hypothetical protein